MVLTSLHEESVAPSRTRAALYLKSLARSHPLMWQTALLVVLTWPAAELRPRGNLDPSYRFALQFAKEHSLRFGHDIVFTYGPLGFLSFPTMYVTGPAVMSLVARATVMALISIFVLRAFSRVLGPTAAFITAFAFIAVTVSPLVQQNWVSETAASALAAGCVTMLVGPELPTVRRRLALVGVGLVAAVLLMVKLNNGIYSSAVGGITALGAARSLPWRHRERLLDLATFGATGFVTFLTGWLLLGQRLLDLPSYVTRSLEITNGYSSSMSFDAAAFRWRYWAALVVVIGMLAAVVPLAIRVSGRLTRPGAALAPVAVVALTMFALFKHGFVRHDAHDFVFFACIPVLGLGVLRRRTASLLGALIATSIVVSWSTADVNLFVAFNPETHLSAAFGQVEAFLMSSRRNDIHDAGVADMQRDYALDDRMRQLLVGTKLHVDPWETGVIFAYGGASWAPVPVFQSYSAYTEALDRLNADRLTSPSGPDHILRHMSSIDGRAMAWESPDYMVKMVCNFQQIYSQKGWYLLARAANRCGSPTVLATVHARFDQPVDVPPPSSCPGIRTVRIDGLLSKLSDRVADFAYKAGYYGIHFEGGPLFRLVPLTGPGQHMLGVPGNPAWVQDGPDLSQYKRLALVRTDGSGNKQPGIDDSTAKLVFECIPYTASARSAASGQ